jgi:threonine/homoserine/homoserine lactone efflux protein
VETLLVILPMGFVMVAGPQIVSSVFLATSGDGRRNSLAYIAGVALATTVGVIVWFIVAGLIHNETKTSSSSAGKNAISYAVIALLAFLIVRVFLSRKESEPPKWMGKLQSASPRFAFKLGFLLFIAMPTDIATEIAVGSYMAQHNSEWWRALPFIGLTVLLIATPLIMLLLLGSRAEVLLPKVRDWMNSNSWIINEAVLAFFLAMTINGLS